MVDRVLDMHAGGTGIESQSMDSSRSILCPNIIAVQFPAKNKEIMGHFSKDNPNF